MSHITSTVITSHSTLGAKTNILGQNGHGTWKYDPNIVHKPSGITTSSGPSSHMCHMSPSMTFNRYPGGRTTIMGGVQWRF